MRTMFVVGFLLLVGIPAVAQETRSTISGTVRDEQGVIPGASVKVTNVGTGVTQQLTTNTSGYFEARLLNAGTYDVVIEMTGFKTLRRAGVTLSSGQTLAIPLTLEIGTIAEEITVTGEAPLLEVTTLRQGLVLDEKKIGELPLQSNMPVLFARFAPGMMARGVIPFAGQGFVGGPTTNATPLGGVGGVDWSIDGATNSGVEPADVHFSEHGHGAGDARRVDELHGVDRSRHRRRHLDDDQGWYQYAARHREPPVLDEQVQPSEPISASRLRRGSSRGKAYEEGASNNLSMTFGGPVQIPGIINGTNKFFTFVNYSYGHDDFNGKSANPTGRFREAIPVTTIWPAIFPTSSCCRIPLSIRSTTR